MDSQLAVVETIGAVVTVGQDAPTPPVTPGTAKTAKAADMKFVNNAKKKWKKKLENVDYAGAWDKFKTAFWKGVDIAEAVSKKDLNLDGKIEGVKPPQTEKERQAQWKKEHEAKRAEHEKGHQHKWLRPDRVDNDGGWKNPDGSRRASMGSTSSENSSTRKYVTMRCWPSMMS